MRNEFLDRQRDRFILFLPVFLGGGMLVYFSLSQEPSLPVSAGVFIACVAVTLAAWRHVFARAAGLCAACAAGGFALACLHTSLAPGWVALPRRAIEVSGTAIAVDILPEGRRVLIGAPSLDGAPALARAVRVRLRNTDPVVLAAGDRMRVRALLRQPAPPDYLGGWDTQRDAFFAHLAGSGFAIGPAEVLQAAPASRWGRLRAGIAQRIMAGLPGPDGAIAATLLTGIGTAIPAADRAAFADSGLAHLLAVAGLHVGIVMGLVFGATRFGLAAWEWAALCWPTRKIAAMAALVAGGGYLALTGAHVPIIRSFAMAALVTLGVLTGRRAVSLRGLALAAGVLLVMAPDSVVGVSFQMSFSAVLALIAGYELARPALAAMAGAAWWRRPALHAAGLALTSLLAGTASMPFAAYHFGRATLYYVPANMLAVPLTAFWVMPCGLAALALMPLGLERLALVPMGWGIGGLQWIAHGVAGWPAAVTDIPRLPAWSMVLVAAGLAWGGLWRGRLRWGGLAPLAVGLAAPLLVRPPDVLVTPQAGVIAFRVAGQVLVQTQHGATPFERAAPGRVWGAPVAGAPCPGDAGCRVAWGERAASLVPAAAGADCGAALVVSTAWLHGACGGAAVIDRAVVADGAAEAWLAGSGVVVRTDRMVRGDRPWVVATRPRLPMATPE